jgi:hypothetical protein
MDRIHRMEFILSILCIPVPSLLAVGERGTSLTGEG